MPDEGKVTVFLVSVPSVLILFMLIVGGFHWHEHKKQQAYESVLVHGYRCSGGTFGRCEPIKHWSEPPEKVSP